MWLVVGGMKWPLEKKMSIESELQDLGGYGGWEL